MTLTRSLLLLSLILFIGGCKTTDSPTGTSNTNTTSSPLRQPKPGSSFIYRLFQIDTTGAIVGNPDRLKFGDTVLAVGISQYGKAAVTQNTSNSLFNGFVNYEPNGDISYYRDPSDPIGQPNQTGKWITIPLASKGKRTSSTPDTAYTIWYTYTGTSQRTVDGMTFRAESFDEYEGPTADGEQAAEQVEWYDAATGILIEMDFPSTRGSNGKLENGERLEITNFNLK